MNEDRCGFVSLAFFFFSSQCDARGLMFVCFLNFSLFNSYLVFHLIHYFVRNSPTVDQCDTP